MHSFSIAHILAQHYTLLVGTEYKNKEVNDQTCFFFCLSLSLNMNTSLSFGMVNGLRFGFTTDSITENKNKRLSLQVLESIKNNDSKPQVLTNSLGKKKPTIIQSKLL